MVKSKNVKKIAKVADVIFPYASKEEEDDFLNFSDDNNSLSPDEDEVTSNIPKKKAFEVDMSDVEMESDDAEIEEDDEIYEEDEINENDVDEKDTLDRTNSRELSKFYSEQNERTVFVGNITPKVTQKVLIQLFNSKKAAGPGAVETVRIRGAVTQEDGNNRHAKRRAVIQKKFKDEENQALCAFVVLKKKEDVEKCIKLNNYEVCGKHIRVDLVKGKKMTYESKNCIFIGNLPFDCNEEQVREAFNKSGEIINVRLVRSKEDGKIKGFGYVEFTESMGVDFSIKMNGKINVGDRKVRIEKWSGTQTQQQKRKTQEDHKIGVSKKRRIVVPTNMKSLELNEYIKSKQKKMNKKVQKKRTFINEKKVKPKTA